jgi:hypothetical protein
MSAAIGHRPTPSVDEDLQKLYNEVWAGFSEEPSAPSRAPSAQDDLDNIYSVYGTEPDYQPPPPQSSTTPVSPVSARSRALLLSVYSIPSSLHSLIVAPSTTSTVPTPPSSARSTGQIRRLPPTPTSPHTLATSPSAYSIPETDPYQEISRPGHYSTDSYASTSSSGDMFRRVTSGSGRKLPQAPVQAFNPYSDRDSVSSLQSQNYDSMIRQPSNHTDPHAAEYRTAPTNGNTFGYGDNYGYPTTPPTPPAIVGLSRTLSHQPSHESVGDDSNNVPGGPALGYADRRAGRAFFRPDIAPLRD